MNRPTVKVKNEFVSLRNRYFEGDYNEEEKSAIEHTLNEMMGKYDWCDEIFTVDGKEGVKNACGEIRINAEYDKIFYLESLASLSYGMPILAMKNEKFYVVSFCGEKPQEHVLDYEEVMPLGLFDIFAVKRSGEEYYALYRLGKGELTPAEIDSCIEPFNNNLVVVRDGKYGFFDLTTGAYISPEYDDFELEIDQYLEVLKDGVKGYVTQKGTFLPLTMDEDLLYETIEQEGGAFGCDDF